jgi:putative transcriptional regulator
MRPPPLVAPNEDAARVMQQPAYLTSQLLIAMPTLADPNFNRTVTLICEHTDQGALGIVINRPLDVRLAEIFSQLDLEDCDALAGDRPVLQGGPVQPQVGFVLHDDARAWDSTMRVSKGLCMTTSRDILVAMARGGGPSHSLVALGYAGWAPGQLEREISENAWLSVTCTHEILFRTPFELRWEAAAKLIGFDIGRLSSEAGHA